MKTLDDARTLLLVVFGSVNARSGALDHCILLLFEAAEHGGKSGSRPRPTRLVLRARRLL